MKKFIDKASDGIKKLRESILLDEQEPMITPAPVQPVPQSNQHSTVVDGEVTEKEVNEKKKKKIKKAGNQSKRQSPAKKKKPTKKKPVKKKPVPKNDISSDGWVITPEEISDTLNEQHSILDLLRSSNLEKRKSGIRQLRVNIKFDALYGLKILGYIFSIYSQYPYSDEVEVEILKLIEEVVSRSKDIIRMKFSLHFYNCIKLLVKNERVRSLDISNPLDKSKVYYLQKLLVYFRFEKGEEDSESIARIYFPTILSLAVESPRYFAKQAFRLVDECPEYFTSIEDIMKILLVFHRSFHQKIPKLFWIFFQKHQNAFILYLQSQVIPKIESCIPLEGKCPDPLDLIYCYWMSRFCPSVMEKHTNLLAVKLSERLRGNIDLQFVKSSTSRNTSSQAARELHMQLYHTLRVFNEITLLSPITTFPHARLVLDCFTTVVREGHLDKLFLNEQVCLYYSYLGYSLKNVEHASKVVEFILKIMDEVYFGRDVLGHSLAALTNISNSPVGRSSVAEDWDRLWRRVLEKVNMYLDHPEPRIREKAELLTGRSSSGNERENRRRGKSGNSSHGGGGGGSGSLDNDAMLQMQMKLDRCTLKIAELSLEIDKLKQKIR